MHERCSKHRKRRDADGRLVPCNAQPVRGLDACRRHTGVTLEQARAKGERRLALGRAMGEAGRMLEAMGGIRSESADPLRTLTTAVAVAAAMVEVFTDLVAGLSLSGVRIELVDETDPDGPRRAVFDPHAVVGPNHLGDLGVHPYVELLRQWTAEAARISKLALDAGVSERQMRLAERDVRQLAAGYRAFVVDLVDELVAAGVERQVVDRVVAAKAPALMRRALEQAGEAEAG